MQGKHLSGTIFQDLLLGDRCCFDFSGHLSLNSLDWKMKCCNQEVGAPVVVPGEDIEEEEILKVNIWFVVV